MVRKIGKRVVSYANVGVPLALGLALTAGAAHAFTAPAAGDLGYDIYDIVFMKSGAEPGKKPQKSATFSPLRRAFFVATDFTNPHRVFGGFPPLLQTTRRLGDTWSDT